MWPRAPPCYFLNATATTVIYTLSLHDALAISQGLLAPYPRAWRRPGPARLGALPAHPRLLLRLAHGASVQVKRVVILGDRKSTRLNSSHTVISYAVFCLKKKK